MDLFIKNMVSMRCKIIVQIELEKLGLRCTHVELERAEILSISDEQIKNLNIALLQALNIALK
jgi:hypothetical protein